MQLDTAQALSQFVGSLATFIAVILAWMNSTARASDMKQDLLRQMQDTRADLGRQIQDTRDLLRGDFRRV